MSVGKGVGFFHLEWYAYGNIEKLFGNVSNDLHRNRLLRENIIVQSMSKLHSDIIKKSINIIKLYSILLIAAN
jgi:hypothetical protein